MLLSSLMTCGEFEGRSGTTREPVTAFCLRVYACTDDLAIVTIRCELEDSILLASPVSMLEVQGSHTWNTHVDN